MSPKTYVDQLRETLTGIDDAVSLAMYHKRPTGWKYSTTHGLVVNETSSEGLCESNVRLLTDVHPHCPLDAVPKECYRNAYIASQYKNLRYCEGFAFAQGIPPLPIAHAWVQDSAGVVYETTWRDVGTAYLGIEVRNDVLTMMILRSGTYGIVHDDYVCDRPFLRFGNDPDRIKSFLSERQRRNA